MTENPLTSYDLERRFQVFFGNISDARLIWLNPAPNVALRGPLFGVMPKGVEKIVKKIYEDKEYTVRYAGEPLSQADFDVWMELLRRTVVDLKKSGERIVFIEVVPSEFMASIGRVGGKRKNLGKNDRDWLLNSLRKLKGTLTITTPTFSKGWMTSPVHDVEWNDYKIRIEVNRSIAWLFLAGVTYLDGKTNRALGRDELARWLANYIASHHDEKVGRHLFNTLETLRIKCGSAYPEKELRKLKCQLNKKLVKLGKIRAQIRFHSWDWDGDVLHVFYNANQLKDYHSKTANKG
jgi:hypothetical protein